MGDGFDRTRVCIELMTARIGERFERERVGTKASFIDHNLRFMMQVGVLLIELS